MPRLTLAGRLMWLAATSWLAFPIHASVVNRCEAPDGAITYTDQSCGEDERFSLQKAYHPPLGSGRTDHLLPKRETSIIPLWSPSPLEVVKDSTQGSIRTAPGPTREKSREEKGKVKPKRYRAME